MIRRTISEFDLPIIDEMSLPEYESLVRAINEMDPNGGVTGEKTSEKHFTITVETVDAF